MATSKPDHHRGSYHFEDQEGQAPTHVELDSSSFDLEKDSVILLEQVRTIDKRRLKEKVAHLDEEIMEKIDQALQISLGLVEV